MTMTKSALACLALGFLAACSGPAATPKAPEAAAEAKVEDFGPVIVSHEAPVEQVTREAVRVLRASFELASDDRPGFVTTAWVAQDATRWPGAQIRVVVEVRDDRVIVRVQCRQANGSCAHTVPNDRDLIAVADLIADQIQAGRGADAILAKMREFKDQVCACADKACVDHVEKSMMEWAMKNLDKMKNMKPTRAQDEAADRIEDAMDACKEKLSSSGASSGGAYTPSPSGDTGSMECDEYLETFDAVVAKCQSKMGPALDAMKQSRDAQAEAFEQWDTLDAASRKAVIEAAAPGCRSATDALRQAATAMGCPL